MLFPTIKLRIEERKTFEFEIIVDRNENTSRSDTNTNNFELHIWYIHIYIVKFNGISIQANQFQDNIIHSGVSKLENPRIL